MLATASTMPDGSQEPAELRIGVLGPLLVRRDGVPVLLGGPGQRALFGLLAVQPGAAIHREAIADVLWAGSSPPGGVAVIQSYVSRLRGLLEPGRTARSRSGLLASDGPYYRLDPSAHGPGTELDLLSFRGLTAAARRAAEAGHQDAAARAYEQALALWRCEPLADVELLHEHPALVVLANERAMAILAYADLAAASGRHDLILPHLRALAARNPLDEASQARLMLALAGYGQRAEALALYEKLRRQLDEELGVLPGRALRGAHATVLDQREFSPNGPGWHLPRNR
jgi:DNA-binding SARP family transcriptional activator